jgi:hypothetical protein
MHLLSARYCAGESCPSGAYVFSVLLTFRSFVGNFVGNFVDAIYV